MPDFANLLPLEFVVNSRCLPIPAAIKAKDTGVDQGEAAGDSKGGVIAKE